MTLLSLRSCLVMLLAAAAAAWPLRVQAQSTAQPTVTLAQPPVLPETVVEAAPAASGAPAVGDESDLTGTVLAGTIFSSPQAYGYRATSSTVGGIIDIPELNFSGTANVVPRAVFDDQQTLQFNEILRNIPAAAPLGDPNFPDRFLLRGYEVQARDFRKDGFLDSTFTPRDFQNIERVEVLKGPASILYGGMSPAGTVNLITKKPLAERFADGGLMFGAYGLDRYMADLNGFATQSGNVLYRVNGAYQTVGSFRDFGFINRGIIAPTATWLINDCTALTVSYEYHRDSRRPDHGNFALGNSPFAFSDNVYFGEPGNDFAHFQDNRVSAMLTTQLGDCWALSIGATGLFYTLDSSQTAAVDPLFNPQFNRARDAFDLEEQADSLIANLAGEFNTGGINHKVLLGTEQVYFESQSLLAQGLLLEPQFDPNNPVFGLPAPILPIASIDVPLFKQVRNGFYGQDLMQIGEQWYLLGGVRYDHLDLRFDRTLNGLPFTNDQGFDRWSPRGGIVYQPIPEVLSFYFSYTKSFTPPGGLLSLNGQAVLPEFGELYEAGFKTELLEGLTLQGCGFHTRRDNVPFTDPITFAFLQDGVERAQGAEVNLVGEITDYWTVIANHAYTDTELSDLNNPLLAGGVQQRNTPYNSGNIWTRYNLYDDGCQVFGLALGMVALSDRTANLLQTVRLPGFTRWDAGAYYTRGSLYASLYIENLFDRQYAASSFDESTNGFLPGVNVIPGAPLNARATVGLIY